MPRLRPRTIAVTLGFALCLLAPPAAAAEGLSRAVEVGEIAFDLTVVRPLNVAALVLGSVVFAGTAPIAAAHGGLTTTWDVFVYGPYEYTFLRGLGDL